MPNHRINLRGPWEFEWIEPPLSEGSGIPTTGRIKMPADWRDTFGERAGLVRLSRRFHQPTGLELGDRVWLVFTGIGGEAVVAVDGVTLEPNSEAGELRFDITAALRPTNQAVVELRCDPSTTDGPLGLYDFVAVEIEPANG